MPISNYGELQVAVGDWLNRADLTARIPDFIALAESKIRRKVRARTVAESALAAADTISIASLPVAHVRSLRMAAPNRTGVLGQVTLEEVFDMRERFADTAGIPAVYAISGTSIYLAPRPDSAYPLRLSYYEVVPALSDAAPTNYLLSSYPDVYLYGALMEAAPYLEESEKIAQWKSLFEEAVFEVNRDFERGEHGANLRAPSFRQVF